MVGGDPWDSSLPYEPFMGRWSRKIGRLFLRWLNPPSDLRWLDVGCGTGALSTLISQQMLPQEVLGIDPSDAFIAYASHVAQGLSGLHFQVAGAEDIPVPDRYFDIAVSALALNFFGDSIAGLREIGRVVKAGEVVAIYVWDYAEGMQMLRHFWDAVLTLDPAAISLDEKVRFPLCRPGALAAAFSEAGLNVREIQALEVATRFASFDDYWQPFLGAVGPAPGYVASLDAGRRADLETALRQALPSLPDGSIPLRARAWAVRANTPGTGMLG